MANAKRRAAHTGVDTAKRTPEGWAARQQRSAEQYAANRDVERAKRQAYYQANKEKWQRRRSSPDPLKHRRWWLLRSYGITLEEYDVMLGKQQGVCAICRLPETKISKKTSAIQNLPVDHCHETGVVRGLLCDRCNKLLGGVRDDPTLLRAAAEYLERHHGQ